jgi:hypothetical protein
MAGIEFNGKIFYTPDKHITTNQLWFIAKNSPNDQTGKNNHVLELSELWKQVQITQCSYNAQHMSTIKEMEEKLYVRATPPIPSDCQ